MMNFSTILNRLTAEPVLFRYKNIIFVKFGVITGICSALFIISILLYAHYIDLKLYNVLKKCLYLLPFSIILFSYGMDWILRFKSILKNPQEIQKISFYFFGGLIGGLFFLYTYLYYLNISFFVVSDILFTFGIFYHGLSRIACLNYGCCIGKPIKGRGLSIVYRNSNSKCNIHEKVNGIALYPVQLYELIFCALSGIILVLLYNYVYITSLNTSLYFILYGLIRYNIENYKYGRYIDTTTTKWQYVSVVMIGIGLLCLVRLCYNGISIVSIFPSKNSIDLSSIYDILICAILYFLLCTIFYGIHIKSVSYWKIN